MLFTSIEISKPPRDRSDAQDQSSCCEVCGAEVDLAKSVVLVKKRRVVGCPDCSWGAVRTGNS
jgi:DNA-directed RNA polymerase subunit RPC12/RpoP